MSAWQSAWLVVVLALASCGLGVFLLYRLCQRLRERRLAKIEEDEERWRDRWKNSSDAVTLSNLSPDHQRWRAPFRGEGDDIMLKHGAPVGWGETGELGGSWQGSDSAELRQFEMQSTVTSSSLTSSVDWSSLPKPFVVSNMEGVNLRSILKRPTVSPSATQSPSSRPSFGEVEMQCIPEDKRLSEMSDTDFLSCVSHNSVKSVVSEFMVTSSVSWSIDEQDPVALRARGGPTERLPTVQLRREGPIYQASVQEDSPTAARAANGNDLGSSACEEERRSAELLPSPAAAASPSSMASASPPSPSAFGGQSSPDMGLGCERVAARMVRFQERASVYSVTDYGENDSHFSADSREVGPESFECVTDDDAWQNFMSKMKTWGADVLGDEDLSSMGASNSNLGTFMTGGSSDPTGSSRLQATSPASTERQAEAKRGED